MNYILIFCVGFLILSLGFLSLLKIDSLKNRFLFFTLLLFSFSATILTPTFLNIERGDDGKILNLHLKNTLSTKKQVILLVGTSNTFHGANPSIINESLKSEFPNWVVEIYARPGFYAHNQDYNLRNFFKINPKINRPQLILFEVGSEHIVPESETNIFKPNKVNYHDWQNFRYILKHIFEVHISEPTVFLKKLNTLVKVFLVKFLNIGVVSQFDHKTYKHDELYSFMGLEAGTDQKTIQLDIDTYYTTDLSKNFSKAELENSKLFLSSSVENFRKKQYDFLKHAGVVSIGYFMPPKASMASYYADLQLRNYGQNFPVVYSLEPELIGHLKTPDSWFDSEHLSSIGASHYSTWLSGKLKNILKNLGNK
jgi:hypothetical protein